MENNPYRARLLRCVDLIQAVEETVVVKPEGPQILTDYIRQLTI